METEIKKDRELHPGDKVTIYKNPYTEEDPEGTAVLERKLQDLGNQELWVVRFIAADWYDTFERWIRVTDKPIEKPKESTPSMTIDCAGKMKQVFENVRNVIWDQEEHCVKFYYDEVIPQ